jgi:fibro-slime domain-containing protein
MVCQRGTETACDSLPRPPTWTGTARDFRESHPDFEPQFGSVEPGLVDATLGDDGKPIYAGRRGTVATSGQANFHGWFHDVTGTNWRTDVDIAFESGNDGSYVYSGHEFFPLDGRLFGNEGRPHNYHFTVELHAEFEYVGGEFLEIEADDDAWVFINRRLVIDLGGLHETLSARADLSAERERLSLEPGSRYPVDVFFAERHTVGSTLSLRTSMTAREWCP